ncbi:uncharacterized protein LOC144441252 [Glandiceps talaboti]
MMLTNIISVLVVIALLQEVKAACDPNEKFECDSGRCIPIYWRCDGNKQCDNNEDEATCPNVECPSTYPFQCKSGKCLAEKWVCDRYLRQDCPDGDDQMNCPGGCNKDYHWECDDTVCIDSLGRCDGKQDCPDGSDEEGCDDISCKDDEFLCNSGQCIPLGQRCDQYVDCPGPDQEDEANCKNPRPCSDYEFQCDNGVCIWERFLCDGVEDCLHGEDESSCGLQCNQCGGAHKLGRSCHQLTTRACPSRQICAITIRQNWNNDLVYIVGCKGKKMCSKLIRRNAPGCNKGPMKVGEDDMCTFCCEDNYCNSVDNLPRIVKG